MLKILERNVHIKIYFNLIPTFEPDFILDPPCTTIANVATGLPWEAATVCLSQQRAGKSRLEAVGTSASPRTNNSRV